MIYDDFLNQQFTVNKHQSINQSINSIGNYYTYIYCDKVFNSWSQIELWMTKILSEIETMFGA